MAHPLHIPTKHAVRAIALGLLACFSQTRLSAETPTLPLPIEDTLAIYCFDCHEDGITKGDLDLANTPFDLTNKHQFETWAHVYDRVKHGEMPPKKKDQPSPEERQQLLSFLRDKLLNADHAEVSKKGRVHGRRLTRTEYEHTLHDLLGIRIPLKNLLPADESGKDFETVADAQQLSHFHLNQYLEAADQALQEAFTIAHHGGKRYSRNHNAKQLTRFISTSPGNYRGPQLVDGKVHSWPRKIAFNGTMAATRVPKTGWYRIRVKNLHGINPGPDQTVWGTLTTGSGKSAEPIHILASIVEATSHPKDLVCDAWMKEGHLVEIKPNEGTNKLVWPPKKGFNSGRPAYFEDRNLQEEGFPALVFDSISIKRIYPGLSQKKLREHLFPGIAFHDGEPVLEEPAQDFSRLIQAFADRAFVRPPTSTQIAPYLALTLKRFEETSDLFEALREGYRAILCSPRFLTFVESPGSLDGHAIATRLSYLFWSSLPDKHLRTLARENKLHSPKVLSQEIDRLLTHPKSERFINNFTDQWLQLNKIAFTTPDPRRYKKFDPVLQESMLQETRAFIRELITENLSIRNFLRSDFGFLNTRLLTHYDFDGLSVDAGKGLQKVPLNKDHRSGLITQGAILKVTADGSVTSPVVRGVWVGERILGRHIPPPPNNVPAIEPDIRGATSIRDQLDKHRNDVSCAACHQKIDPPGFALESYDPIGQYRTFYGKRNRSARVDPSGETLEGHPFESVLDWKNIYLRQPETLARAFTEQLISYSTGATTRFSDRNSVEMIVNNSKANDYGLRSLLEGIITSDIFLKK